MATDGAAQFRVLATKLRAAGDGGLTRRVRKDIRATAKPLTDAVREAAREKLPHGGGLNEVVASQRVTVSVLMSARTSGIRLRTRDTGAAKRDNQGTDEGQVRHPVFGQQGRKAPWVDQSIPQASGWWSKTLADKGPVVGAAMVRTINALSEELAHL